MKYQPYPFQRKIIDEVSENFKKNKNVLIQQPTRSGKSVALCYFCEIAYKTNRPVLILAHTEILIKQISEDLLESGIPHGIIKSGHYESRDIIQVASVQTLHKRKERMNPDRFRLAIFDESHRIKAKTYLEVRNYFKNARWLGLTATPIRPSSGEGFEDIFDCIVHGPTKKELIKMGFLAETRVASPMPSMIEGLVESKGDYTKKSSEAALNKTFIHGEYVEHYFDYGIKPDGRKMKGLVFVPTVDFGKQVSENYNASGVPTVEISSRDSKDERKRKLDAYYAGEYLLLVSVGLFMEGFTVKECEIIVCLRPTSSIIVWLQMSGRGSMKCEGKDYLVFVDCCNNMYKLGHPDQDFEWKLEGETKEKKKARIEANEEKVVRCDFCKWSYDIVEVKRDGIKFNPLSKYFIQKPEEKPLWANKPDAIFCPICGAPRETKGRVLRQIEGSLSLISLEDYEKYQADQKWAIEEKWLEDQRIAEEKRIKKKRIKEARTYDQMLALEKEYGHKEGWAARQLHARRYAAGRYTAPRF